MNKISYSTLFKRTFVTVGSLQMLFGFLSFTQGIRNTMDPFGLPPSILESPHYLDAMLWVFLHMTVMGSILITVGLFSTETLLQKWLPRVMLVACGIYAYLDIRASDHAWGTALYQGPRSLVTPIVSLSFALLFLNLCVRKRN